MKRFRMRTCNDGDGHFDTWEDQDDEGPFYLVTQVDPKLNELQQLLDKIPLNCDPETTAFCVKEAREKLREIRES